MSIIELDKVNEITRYIIFIYTYKINLRSYYFKLNIIIKILNDMQLDNSFKQVIRDFIFQ